MAVAAGFASAALFGLVLQVAVFRFMHGEDLRQTLVTIGLSIMMADVLLWIFGGEIYQFDPPRAIFGRTPLPIVQVYPTYRLVLLAMSAAIGVLLWWFLNRTRVGMMIRAGVDDRGMLAASGVNVQFVFAITFAIGAGLAGFAGVVGGTALSIAPARTRATSSPRSWWSSWAGWGAWSARRSGRFSSGWRSSSGWPTRRRTAWCSPS